MHKTKTNSSTLLTKYSLEFNIFFRYLIILAGIYIYSSDIFSEVLIYIFNILAYLFLKIFIVVKLEDNILYLANNSMFVIVKECIAISAYIFITTIIFSIPLNFKKGFSVWIKCMIVFTVVNLVRILFLMWVHIQFGVEVYNKFHLIFYEGVSGIILALIIIYFFRRENIKKMYPVFTDIKTLVTSLKSSQK